VINVVTVHWQTPKWVEVQLGYLERNLDGPFRVFAALNGIEDRGLHKRFFFAEDLPGTHYEKLNHLAEIVAQHAGSDDPLVFLDGDAFPVRPLLPWMSEVLAAHPLAAVRRDENAGDHEPHASFCATTTGFWQDLGGDWSDYGRVLLRKLEAGSVDWLPLLRTNTHDLHPLWFAIYGHRIYHHGAGFRQRVSKVDEGRLPELTKARPRAGPGLDTLVSAAVRDPGRLLRVRPRHVPLLAGAIAKTAHVRRRARFAKEAEPLSDQVFARLSTDPDFYKTLDDADG
jgi:hypothetical protein